MPQYVTITIIRRHSTSGLINNSLFNNSVFNAFSFQADPGCFLCERGQVGGTKLFLLVISIKSGYSKETLVQLLTDYRNLIPMNQFLI